MAPGGDRRPSRRLPNLRPSAQSADAFFFFQNRKSKTGRKIAWKSAALSARLRTVGKVGASAWCEEGCRGRSCPRRPSFRHASATYWQRARFLSSGPRATSAESVLRRSVRHVRAAHPWDGQALAKRSPVLGYSEKSSTRTRDRGCCRGRRRRPHALVLRGCRPAAPNARACEPWHPATPRKSRTSHGPHGRAGALFFLSNTARPPARATRPNQEKDYARISEISQRMGRSFNPRPSAKSADIQPQPHDEHDVGEE
jgi:hypothetical protein